MATGQSVDEVACWLPSWGVHANPGCVQRYLVLNDLTQASTSLSVNTEPSSNKALQALYKRFRGRGGGVCG